MDDTKDENQDQKNLVDDGGNIPHLLILNGREKGSRIAVGKRRFIIGRKIGDLIISDSKVSSAHAALEITNDGFILIDLESTNGTALNGKKVKMSPISSGDEITLGTTVIKFVMEEPTGEVGQSLGNADTDGGELDSVKNIGRWDEGQVTGVRQRPITNTQVLSEPGADAKKSQYSLKVENGPDRGQVYCLTLERTAIGRLTADINFDDPDVSRKHAMIEISEKEVVLRDLNSKKGVFVNNRRIMNCRLKGGEKIQIGNVILSFNSEE